MNSPYIGVLLSSILKVSNPFVNVPRILQSIESHVNVFFDD